MKQIIPEEALSNHIAFLGGTGSGKTSAAKQAVVEPALRDGKKVLIIDPTDAYFGLRLKANGKSEGFPIHVFGGRHADFPLRPVDAEVLADTFASSSDSAVFCTAEMTVADRTTFFTKFAEVILRKNKGPVFLIIDEAHLFMPQAGAQAGGMAPAMLHAGNNLVSLGRSRGFRISLLSQRPAKLHKDALSQVQTMVAMRAMSPQDRKAMREWMQDQADADKSNDIVASLPGLKPGEGWVWSPIVGMLEKVHFPLPTTFDSSKAPDDGEDAPVLKPIDADALKEKLAKMEAEIQANDPRALKNKVRELEAKLAAAPSKEPAMSKEKLAEIFDAGHAKGFQEGGAEAIKRCTAIVSVIPDNFSKLMTETYQRNVQEKVPRNLISGTTNTPGVIPAAPRPRGPDLKASMGAGSEMSGPERKTLTLLAQYPDGLPKRTLCTMAGYRFSGGFRNTLASINVKGWAQSCGDMRLITQEGLNALGKFDPLPQGPELRMYWLNKLSGPASKILEHLASIYPASIDKNELAAATGYSFSGGFRNSIAELNVRSLIEKTSEGIRMSALLA